MKNWKIPAGCAVFAFAIALITGLFGGVSFGMLILRSVVSGIAFGGIVYGFLLVIQARLPELYAILSPSEPPGVEQEGVDIVISDEDDSVSSAPEPAVAGGDSFAEEVHEEAGSAEEGKLGELESAEGQGEEPQELGDIEDGFDKFGQTEELSDISGKEAEVVEVLGEFQDPQDVARAVQTMMKRDEE